MFVRFVWVAATLAASVFACGGNVSSDPGGGGAGTTGKPGACPTALPGPGTSCAGSLQCMYGHCAKNGEADLVARCEGGTWKVSEAGPCDPPIADCPPSQPDHGSTCFGAMSCSYPQGPCCGPTIATCAGGTWDVPITVCDPPPMVCPDMAPSAGEPCFVDECGGISQACTYGSCDGKPEVVAVCNGKVWEVIQQSCAPPPCEVLGPCDCFDRADCQPVSDGCLCDCDYDCPGKPPCDCFCGGGAYLGCKAA